ncbi:MAG TPA: M56 family metallopeptidase, partial [Pirellulales bacterium]|nr:M56 family metallopeptidase [Pirellulales bacterium]
MNALAPVVLWSAVQVTLFTAAGMLLYLFVRRLGPAAGALAASALLLTTIGISASAISPWPHWFARPAAEAAHAEEKALATNAVAQPSAPGDKASAAAAALPEELASADPLSGMELAGAAWRGFWQELQAGRNANAAMEEQGRDWPSLLGVAFLTGLAVALMKLGLGLFAVRQLRADSTVIDDGDLRRAADEICQQLNCRRNIEVRQSRRLRSPATIGWRRPLVLLPAYWQTWTAEERRVVLAHEIAHVGRGDYCAGLLAQFSLALHFYHPLVHWLARRLRLEQELAADALGAEAAGGRQAYLMTLAQMALKQDDRAIAWAARPFLPSRGAFLRRIEMLRNPRQFRPAAISRGRQIAIIVIVGVIGLLSAGLRGPQDESVAQQPAKQPAAVAAGSDSEPATAQAEVDWSYIPPNAAVVGIVRPAALFSRGEMQPLAELIDGELGLRKALGLGVNDLAEVQLAIPRFPSPQADEPDVLILVLRAKATHDWKDLAAKVAGDHAPAEFLGQTYYKASDARTTFSYYLPDDRTIVLS